jgi:PKD repeat protein
MPDHTTRAAIVAGKSEWSIRRTAWHRVKPSIMPSWLTALAVNLFAGLAACLLVSIANAADKELRDRSYYQDEVYRGQRPRDPQERDKARMQVPHIADQDLHNIAILVDDGTLVVPNPPSAAWKTDTDAIMARFYLTHTDVYDLVNINVASSFTQDVNPEGGFAFEQNVSNAVSGINLGFFNSGGSVAPGVTNLRSILNMNDLGEYGRDPSEPLPGFLNATSGVGVLCQEAGHMVGAFVTANNADILGRSNAHWSFFFETYGSSLEGNGWQNNGGNSYTTIASNRHMSQLDNYLWGFLLPTAITDPMYVLNNPVPNLVTTQSGDSSLPTEGVTVMANTTTTVSINNITAVHGARFPSATTSQKAYKMAWILVIPAGTSAIPADLEKIDDFRTQWEEDFFPAETNGIGSMSSELVATNITVDFEARVLEGEVGLTVEFDNDSFGSIAGFLWDFGDGDTSTERHPTHTYDKFGPFDVSLTVTGTGGPTTVTKTGYIRVGPSTKHFSDDFENDLGWTVEAGGTATTGLWLRANPVGTLIQSTFGNDTITAEVQAENDHTPAGVQCLVTGNALAGEGVGANDVDGGLTTIVSPLIDLTGATAPVLSWWSWFDNNAGASPGRDLLDVEISDDNGANWVLVRSDRSSHHAWEEDQVRLLDHISLTDSVRIRFRTGDTVDGSIVEALIDDICIFDVDSATDVTDFEHGVVGFALERSRPSPFSTQTVIQYAIPSPGSAVHLKVYSVDGRLVRTLVDGHVSPGVHTVNWNGLDNSGRRVANGVYLYQLQTVKGNLDRKVFYIR